MAMRAAYVRYDRLVTVCALKLLAVGVLLLSVNDAVTPAPRPGDWVNFIAALGSVLLLISLRWRIRPLLRATVHLVAILPIIGGTITYLAAGVFPGVAMGAVYSLCLLLSPWLGKPDAEAADGALPDLNQLAFAAVLGITAVLLVWRPDALPWSGGMEKGYLAWALGLVGMAGAAVLVRDALAGRAERLRSLTGQAFVGALPAALIVGYASMGSYMAALIWFLPWISVALWPLISPWRRRLANQATPSEPSDWFAQHLDEMVETCNWVLAVILIGLGSIGHVTDPIAVYVHFMVIALLSVYNMVAFWLLPRAGTPGTRVLWHMVFASLMIGFILVPHASLGSLVAVLVMFAPISGRLFGVRTARRMVLLGLSVLALAKISAGMAQTLPASRIVTDTAIDLLVIGMAAWLGMAVGDRQRSEISRSLVTQESLKGQVDYLTLLNRISFNTHMSLDLDQVLKSATKELGEGLQVDRCVVWLQGKDGNLRVTHEYDSPEATSLGIGTKSFLIPLLPIGSAGQVSVVSDFRAEAGRLGISGEVRPSISALIAVPLVAQGKYLGALSVQQCTKPRDWSPVQIELVQAAAGQVAVAISHARLHQELVAAGQELLSHNEELMASEEELRGSQEELSTSEAKYRTLVEQVQDGFFVVEEGKFTVVNRSFAAMAGYTEAELLGTSPWLLVVLEDLPMVQSSYEHRAQGLASPISYECRLLHKEAGRWVYARINSGYMTVHGKRMMIGTATDITDRKQMEAALRESEERYRLLSERSPDAIFVYRSDGILFANPAAAALAGAADPGALLGTCISDLVHPKDWGGVRKRCCGGSISEADEFATTEIQFLRADGTSLDVEVAHAVVPMGGEPAVLMVGRDITERKRFEERLVAMANYDSLTELLNRRRFQADLEEQIGAAHGLGGALLFLDLDEFKYVNDTMGHQAGDRLLRSLAGLLKAHLRQTDLIGRLGGDEFGIMLPGVGEEQATVVAGQILEALSQHTEVVNGMPIIVTASIGIALYPGHATTAEGLLTRADMAMYRAKEVGPNKVRVYTAEMAEQLQMESKLEWEGRIRDALENDRFVLYYQPIVSVETGAPDVYELLVRMETEDGEIILPGVFLGVAERFGLILSVDRWVLSRAIAVLAALHQAGQALCFSINLSAKCLLDRELVSFIEAQLRESLVPPRCLILEITETSAIDNLELGSRLVERLKQIGCRIALDDFGSGFSSFSYLKHLPVDFLKIDGSFVQNLTSSPSDSYLVRAMVELARGLGKQTVAEFVGDLATMGMLEKLGIDYAQGYHFGHPAPLQQLILEKAPELALPFSEGSNLGTKSGD